MNRVLDALLDTSNAREAARVSAPAIESLAYGVGVLMPMEPDEVTSRLPPATLRPLDACKDPALNPPVKVEVPDESAPWISRKPVMMEEVAVADEETKRLPPLIVNPFPEAMLPALNPPLKVEVPLARAPVTSKKFARIEEVAVRELPRTCREPLMVRVLDAADPPMPTLPD